MLYKFLNFLKKFNTIGFFFTFLCVLVSLSVNKIISNKLGYDALFDFVQYTSVFLFVEVLFNFSVGKGIVKDISLKGLRNVNINIITGIVIIIINSLLILILINIIPNDYLNFFPVKIDLFWFFSFGCFAGILNILVSVRNGLNNNVYVYFFKFLNILFFSLIPVILITDWDILYFQSISFYSYLILTLLLLTYNWNLIINSFKQIKINSIPNHYLFLMSFGLISISTQLVQSIGHVYYRDFFSDFFGEYLIGQMEAINKTTWFPFNMSWYVISVASLPIWIKSNFDYKSDDILKFSFIILFVSIVFMIGRPFILELLYNSELAEFKNESYLSLVASALRFVTTILFIRLLIERKFLIFIGYEIFTLSIMFIVLFFGYEEYGVSTRFIGPIIASIFSIIFYFFRYNLR